MPAIIAPDAIDAKDAADFQLNRRIWHKKPPGIPGGFCYL